MRDDLIIGQITESISVKQRILTDVALIGLVKQVADECVAAYRRGNGSAADAQHIAAEFVGRYGFDRPGLAAAALTTDTSMLTAIGNDYGFEQIFRRQLEANGRQGDVFIGISTSGNSPNILGALQFSREIGIVTVGLTGQAGGKMKALCDYCIQVPSTDTPRIQESHIMLGHIVCAIVEDELFGEQADQ